MSWVCPTMQVITPFYHCFSRNMQEQLMVCLAKVLGQTTSEFAMTNSPPESIAFHQAVAEN